MRSFLLLLPLATVGMGCQGTRHCIDHLTLLQREEERLNPAEKRKQAIFDLSGMLPSNGPDAYYQKQAEQPRSR
jgi:hypothetical protein